MTGGKTHFTVPGTQMSWQGAWCAGHPWRSKRGLWWVHHLGHRLHLLHNQPSRYPITYLESKP